MLVKVLIGVAVVVVALAAYVASQPSEFSVSRTATFAVPAPTVFAQVNELRKWKAWSPWAKKDPNAKESYEGPAAGTGAIMSWAGNNEVGEGRMTIVESRPAELVRFKLEFFKPFAATNTAAFEFRPEGQGTRVTWTMNGRNNFIGKAMCLVFDMDKMVGGDFEQGLAGIRQIVESKS
ncbi:MAG TPA: SRPBCC family protein [Burkholderiales bacterium]|nr:SRPBCC family protein [Burkholderiales bacterium]